MHAMGCWTKEFVTQNHVKTRVCAHRMQAREAVTVMMTDFRGGPLPRPSHCLADDITMCLTTYSNACSQ